MKHYYTAQRGFTLAELAISALIIGLLFFLMIPASQGVFTGKARDLTKQRLATIESAIANYVALNKRLPCPADAVALTGTELRDAATGDCSSSDADTTEQKRGVVPWTTLGLGSGEVLDGWGNQITYRVGFGLTRDGRMDMSFCDPIGTADVSPVQPTAPSTVINLGTCPTVTCTGTTCGQPQKFLINKGFRVTDGANVLMDPTNLYNGAAYVIISHGENAVGAFRSSGTSSVVSDPLRNIAGTTLEAPNHNGGNAISATNTAASPSFRDAPYSDGSNAAVYFDDIMVRPSVFALIQRANLGPRVYQ